MNRIWSLVVISTPLPRRSAGHSIARSADSAPHLTSLQSLVCSDQVPPYTPAPASLQHSSQHGRDDRAGGAHQRLPGRPGGAHQLPEPRRGGRAGGVRPGRLLHAALHEMRIQVTPVTHVL